MTELEKLLAQYAELGIIPPDQCVGPMGCNNPICQTEEICIVDWVIDDKKARVPS